MNPRNPSSDENNTTYIAGSGKPSGSGDPPEASQSPKEDGSSGDGRNQGGADAGSGSSDAHIASAATVIGFSTDGDGLERLGKTQTGGSTEPDVVDRRAETTVINPQIRKDSEDFFDTLEEDGGDGAGKPSRGFVVGDYLIVGELGRGGMGVVYKARHRKLNRLVAIKMVLAGQHSDSDTIRRFISEAQAVAKFQHPGIVQIFEIGEHQSLPFMVLELVEGSDLQRDLKGLPRDAQRSAELVESLCQAMQYAHDRKVLHRDLKPANVLLTADGKPKISDFGLARNMEANGSGATSDGTVMGSPSYMSPEQAGGQLSMISARSDVYSLGAILYQMLTSRPPFVGERPYDTVMQVIHNEPVAPRVLLPGIPVDLETICLKALQKNPEARYSSCTEFASDLRRFLNGEPVLARPVSAVQKAWRWCRRNPRVAIPSGLAALFITLTAGISTWAWGATASQAKEISDQRDKAVAQEQIARKNEELARKQAMTTLQTIQTILQEIDTRLRQFPNAADVRLAVLETLEKKCQEIDEKLVGGIEGEAVPTLLAIRTLIADIYAGLGKYTEADTRYSQLIKEAEARIELKNRTDATRWNVASILVSWAPVRARLSGDPDDGLRLREQARQHLQDIIENPKPVPGSPKFFQVRFQLGAVLLANSNVWVKKGRLDELERDQTLLLKTADDMLREIAESPEWFKAEPERVQSTLRMAFVDTQKNARKLGADLLLRKGKADEAIKVYEELLSEVRTRAEGQSAGQLGFAELEAMLRLFGRTLNLIGQFGRAKELLTEAVSVSEQIEAVDQTKPDLKTNLANNLYQLAIACHRTGDDVNATALLERAVGLRLEVFKEDDVSRSNLMLCQAAAGKTAEATTFAKDLSAKDVKNPELHIDIARALSNVSRHEQGEQKTAAQQGCIENLKRAVSEGYVDVFYLQNEPDLYPVRDLPEFQQLIQGLK